MDKGNQPKKKWKTWQKVTMTVAVILLLAGLGFLLFPTVSNFFGQQRANATIDHFNTVRRHIVPSDADGSTSDQSIPGVTAKSFKEAREKGEVDEEGYVITEEGIRYSDSPVVFRYDLDALRRDSLAYNTGLIDHQGTVDTTNYATPALRMSDYGLSSVYCYLSADAINLYLPVYLGASEDVMAYGAAHLSGTSLPVDQTNTNVAIAGHTDYIGRIFFDNIRKLEIGDTVSIHNYWEDIDYQVIDYKVVTEDETADIYIQKDRQLLTLITCIYAGSPDTFDRYLVICEKKT
ncbi:MAG TPA: hypothetical protein DCY72_01690 [Ruminococcaceae bacterium]|nr:hypothetical protein [Oscillospiraceae bacterium]